jgi:ribosomal protein L7/L12
MATLAGILWIIGALLRGPDYVSVAVGLVYLLIAGSYFYVGLQRRRREERAYDQALPAPTIDVAVLAGQGQKIQAIRRYRKLNPGIGLKEAKDVVDGL